MQTCLIANAARNLEARYSVAKVQASVCSKVATAASHPSRPASNLHSQFHEAASFLRSA